jgi:hypothetical protein
MPKKPLSLISEMSMGKFGDQRLTRRLPQIVAALAAHL